MSATVADDENCSLRFAARLNSARSALNRALNSSEESSSPAFYAKLIAGLQAVRSISLVSEASDLSIVESNGRTLAWRGLLAMQSMLDSLRSDHPDLPLPTFTLPGGGMSHVVDCAGFVYEDVPTRGWEKIVLLSTGCEKAKLSVGFLPPNKSTLVQSRPHLDSLSQSVGISADACDLFDFREVFCVCQTPQSLDGNYIECSFGRCGCNSWVHPECVGLGHKTIEEIKHMGNVICPLCTAYLNGEGLAVEAPSKTHLHHITPGLVCGDVPVRGFVVEESAISHRVWGLEGSACAFESNLRALTAPAGAPSEPDSAEDDVNDVVLSPNSKRRKIFLDGKGIVRVGVIGGFLHKPIAPTPFAQLPLLAAHDSAHQLNQKWRLAMLSQLALRGYRPRDGGVRMWSGVLGGGMCGAAALRDLCASGRVCGLCCGELHGSGQPASVSMPFSAKPIAVHSFCATVVHADALQSLLPPVVGLQHVTVGFLGVHRYNSEMSASSYSKCSLCGHSGGLLLDVALSFESHGLSLLAHFVCASALRECIERKACSLSLDSLNSIDSLDSTASSTVQVAGALRGSLALCEDPCRSQQRCSVCGIEAGPMWQCLHLLCCSTVHPLCAVLSVRHTCAWQVQLGGDRHSIVGAICSFHSEK